MPDFLYVMPLTSTFRIISTISPEMYMLQKSKIDNVLKVKILNWKCKNSNKDYVKGIRFHGLEFSHPKFRYLIF